MSEANEDLWRCVANRATVSLGTEAVPLTKFLCEAKVDKFYVALVVQHDVVWLHIAVDDVA